MTSVWETQQNTNGGGGLGEGRFWQGGMFCAVTPASYLHLNSFSNHRTMSPTPRSEHRSAAPNKTASQGLGRRSLSRSLGEWYMEPTMLVLYLLTCHCWCINSGARHNASSKGSPNIWQYICVKYHLTLWTVGVFIWGRVQRVHF